MPTSPTTAPVAAPTAVARPERRRSSSAQVQSAAAAAVLVFTNARAATPFAARAEPALKPNQPNQRRPAPSRVRGTLCGTDGARRKSPRGARPPTADKPRGAAGAADASAATEEAAAP